jgi:hypothetical protein
VGRIRCGRVGSHLPQTGGVLVTLDFGELDSGTAKKSFWGKCIVLNYSLLSHDLLFKMYR